MLITTKGIVLHFINYSESSIIASIYTQDYGRKSFIVSGVRKRKSKIKLNVFQPLSIVELVAYHKTTKELHRIKEIKIGEPYFSIPSDIHKKTVVLFLEEILSKTIKEEEENKALFDFMENSLRYFDTKGTSPNFHISFLLQFLRYLGFPPNNKFPASYKYFNLRTGSFEVSLPKHEDYLNTEMSSLIRRFFVSTYDESDKIYLNHSIRGLLLEKIILYYTLHLDGLKPLKSLSILKEIYS